MSGLILERKDIQLTCPQISFPGRTSLYCPKAEMCRVLERPSSLNSKDLLDRARKVISWQTLFQPEVVKHEARVAYRTGQIATEVGGFSKEEVQLIEIKAVAHDIGKMSVPDEILNNPGRLNVEETEVIRQHPTDGCFYLMKWGLSQLRDGAALHQELLTGKGYPFGLKGNEIPKDIQFITAADISEATSSRSHRRGRLPSVEEVIKELNRISGVECNGEAVDVVIWMLKHPSKDVFPFSAHFF